MSNQTNITLLDDDPVTSSAFEWHQKVAEALKQLIQQDTQGKIIGLFGAWGSGKSSVITILKNLLAHKSNHSSYKLFTFDAWIHSHDPLRRSFFEELVNFYAGNKLTKLDTWKNDLNFLSRRQEDATIDTTPVILKERTG